MKAPGTQEMLHAGAVIGIGIMGVCRAAAPTSWGLAMSEAGCARRPAWQAPGPGPKRRASSLLLSTSPPTPSLGRDCTEGLLALGSSAEKTKMKFTLEE